MQSIVAPRTVYYNNDNWQVLCEYDAIDGAFEQWYAYGNYVDDVLIKGTSNATGSFQYYLHDHLYSPVAITNGLGVPAERYEYDAYGNPHALDPTTPYAERPLSNSLSRYLFTGRELDIFDSGSLKIQYNRNRYYDSYTGRWTTQDPVSYLDGLNLYEYADSGPVSGIDPFGDINLEDCDSTLGGISADPSLKELHDRAKAKKNLFGSCLKKMKCKECCSGDTMGLYDPFKRQITLCAQGNPSTDELKKTIKHELIHAISVCGNAMPKTCKACMKEEIRAYYWSGTCGTTPGTPDACAKAAWSSCRAGGPFSPCGLARKDGYDKHIPSAGEWPPGKVDGLPSDSGAGKSGAVKQTILSPD